MSKKNIVIISLILLIIVMVFDGYYTCPMVRVLHIACPGCGMTRAYMALFKGDISSAMYYHPLFMMPVFVVVMMLLQSKINKRLYDSIMIGCIVLVMVVYVYRLFTSGTLISLIK